MRQQLVALGSTVSVEPEVWKQRSMGDRGHIAQGREHHRGQLGFT